MASIYVAGDIVARLPVAEKRALNSLYVRLRNLLRAHGYDVVMPEIDKTLDALDNEAFFAAVSRRIEKADHVITIVTRGGSYSPPVEAAVASQRGKKQVILVPPGKRPPRMLAGLPFVVAIGSHSEMPQLVEKLVRGGGGSDDQGGGVQNPPRQPRPAPRSRRPGKRIGDRVSVLAEDEATTPSYEQHEDEQQMLTTNT